MLKIMTKIAEQEDKPKCNVCMIVEGLGEMVFCKSCCKYKEILKKFQESLKKQK